MANKRGKVVTETKTEYPAPDLGQIPSDEDQPEMDQGFPPEADEFIAMLENLPGASPMKAQLFRVLPDSGELKWLSSLTAKDCNIAAPQETIRARWGGGKYTVRATHPGTNQTVETTFDIEGPPKSEGSASPFSIHIPAGKNGSDGEVIASVFSLVMDMNNKFMLQMAEQQRESTKMVVAALERSGNGGGGSGLSLDDVLKYKALFSDNETASAKKLEHWISIGSLLIEKVSQIVAPQSDNPWAALFNSLGPKIAETASVVMGSIAAKRGMVPAAAAAAATTGGATTGGAPTGSPSGPVGASVPQVTEEQLLQMRQYFENSILPDWIDAADRNEDPYSIKRNVRQLIQDTRHIWHFLGLNGPDAFYAKYPKTRQQKEWFDDLFYYLNNPEAPPKEENDNENGVDENAPQVELIR